MDKLTKIILAQKCIRMATALAGTALACSFFRQIVPVLIVYSLCVCALVFLLVAVWLLFGDGGGYGGWGNGH